jgi:hypothetical protein
MLKSTLLDRIDTSDKEAAAVRLYLDESGTRDPNTPQAVVGGMIINRPNFLHFEECWDGMLEKHGTAAPLHMREFTPHGRFAGISPLCRRELFLEVAELIDSHKVASIAATLTNAEYEATVPIEVRRVFSVYGMCFNLAVVMNHKLAEGEYGGEIPFILDTGNPYTDHVREAHAAILQRQKEGSFLHAGDLFFDDDAEFGALQAADIIAWGARRLASGLSFPPGLEVIGDILAPHNGHNENNWKAEWLKELRERLLRRMAEAARGKE